MEIQLPYYTGKISGNLPDELVQAVLTSGTDEYQPEESPLELVKAALANPIGTSPLSELAKGKQKVMVITSDHTRAMPSKLTMPLVLAEIRAGNPDAEITIMIATGLHRPTTNEELAHIFGPDLVAKETIISHQADVDEMVDLGVLPSGSPLKVNKMVMDADLLVCEGFIEPHFFAGFSGGRKSILPGVCSGETIRCNHSSRAIGNAKSTTGVLAGNPIHEDMAVAASKVGVDFILNVALNGKKEVIAAFAGDLEKAHQKGCEFVDSLAGVDAVPADIVITSNGGYPLDQNLYQCPKAVSTAAACVKEGGIIIIAASCCDGVGGDEFEHWMLKGDPKGTVDRIMTIPDTETMMEQWCVQIMSRIMIHHQIILITDRLDHAVAAQMKIIPASTVDEAVALALKAKGPKASITVIPDGVAVMLR